MLGVPALGWLKNALLKILQGLKAYHKIREFFVWYKVGGMIHQGFCPSLILINSFCET